MAHKRVQAVGIDTFFGGKVGCGRLSAASLAAEQDWKPLYCCWLCLHCLAGSRLRAWTAG
jgi:hypothetical protein